MEMVTKYKDCSACNGWRMERPCKACDGTGRIAYEVDSAQAIREGKLEINEILAKLESDTGTIVEAISLERIEITSMEDIAERFQTSVLIELKRVPGQQWSTK